MPTIPRVSSVVAQQLPEFIRADHATFVAFVEAYYAWMEESGNAINRSGLLLQSLNVDTTLDEFIDYFCHQFLPGIPQHLITNKAFLIAHAKEFYRTKGTENSFKLLFRLLFDEEITISYPKDLILRVSDGKWIKKQSLRLDPFLWSLETATGSPVFRLLNPSGSIGEVSVYIDGVLQSSGYTLSPNLPILVFDTPPAVNSEVKIVYSAFNILSLINTNEIVLSLRGESSGATAISENGERLFLPGQEIFNLNVSGVEGTFQTAETITADYTPFPGFTLRVYAQLASFLDSIQITDEGANYNIGDLITINTGSPTTPANAVIDQIYTTLINNIRVLNGGCGFQAGLLGHITSTPNTGLTVAVASVDTSGVVHPNSYPIVTDVLSLFANVIMSNSNYGFLPAGNEDANTVILNALSTITYGGGGQDGLGPITNVAILTSTESFTTSPTIQFDGAVAFVTGNTANGNTATANVELNYFGILGRMNVISGGTGYQVGDELVFTNVPGIGFGQGAAAQVIEIHSANTGIKTVQFQPSRISGTVNVSANSTQVLGTGTAFTTELLANNRISINTETSYVQSITNNTHLIVNTAFTRTGTGLKLGVYDRYFVGGINYRLDAPPIITVSSRNPSATGANIIAEGVIAGGEIFLPESEEGHSPGGIRSIRLIHAGAGFTTTPTIDLTTLGNGRATALAVLLANLFTSEGYYDNQDGMISSDRKIEGVGTLYQQHSYVIQAGIDLTRYKNILKALVHPAGMQMFGEFVCDHEIPTGNASVTGTIQVRFEDESGNLIVFDSSENEYHGYTIGFPTFGEPGPLKISATANSYMAHFSGNSNNSILIGDRELLSSNNSQFTIEYWAAFDNAVDTMGVLRKSGRDNGGPWEYSIFTTGGPLAFNAWSTGGALAYDVGVAVIPDTNLHHWAVTANGTHMLVYRDAHLISTTANTINPMSNTAGEFEIGVGNQSASYYRMKGRLGHVAFFRKALTHAQIITRYGASNNQIARTNYFTNSIDIGHAAWGKENVTILTDRTDLFGSNIADKIVETANNNYHRIYQITSAPLGKQTTISCYAKAAERGNLALQITDGGANNAYGLFDLNNQRHSSLQAPKGYVNTKMVAVANGMYRCSVTWDGTVNSVQGFLYLCNNSTNSIYTGNTSSGLYAGGLQLETSYERDNFIQYPVQIDNDSHWTRSNTTIGPATANPFDGTADAPKLVETANNGVHDIYSEVLPIAHNTTYTVSVYAKAAERSNIEFIMDNGAGGNYVRANVQSGVIWLNNQTYGLGATFFSSNIAPASNGFSRITISGQLGTSNTGYLVIRLCDENGSDAYAGNTSKGLYVWGPRWDLGNTALNFGQEPGPTALIATGANANTITVYANTVLDDVPSGYWKLDENYGIVDEPEIIIPNPYSVSNDGIVSISTAPDYTFYLQSPDFTWWKVFANGTSLLQTVTSGIHGVPVNYTMTSPNGTQWVWQINNIGLLSVVSL